MFGSKITLVLVVALVIVMGSSAAYFRWSQGRINDLVADNSKLTVAIKVQESTINTLQQSAERQAGEIFSLQQNVAAAEQERRTLEGKLRKLNLQMMARNNAAELESRINQATARAFGDIETLTRSGNPPPQQSSAPRGEPSTPATSSTASASVPPPEGSQPPPRPPVRTPK